MYCVRSNKLKTHRVIMTGHSYGGMIVSLITESLIRNGIDTTYTSEQRRRYTSPNTEIFRL
jgi:putative lipase involved disintegration of autophagic bodies